MRNPTASALGSLRDLRLRAHRADRQQRIVLVELGAEQRRPGGDGGAPSRQELGVRAAAESRRWRGQRLRRGSSRKVPQSSVSTCVTT